MKLSDTTKLYKQLAPHQAAALAFEAVVRRDDAELSAVVDNQQRVLVTTPNLAYTRRAKGLYAMALFYGVLFWQTRAYLINADRRYDDDDINRYAQLLGSIEQALIDVCKVAVVDVAIVCQAGMGAMAPEFLEYADPKITAEYREMLTNLIC